jgi:WD40 repeat protein
VIAVYQSAGGRPVARFENVPGRVRALAFSPDGLLVASGQDGPRESSVRIWDVRQPDAVQEILGPPNYASAVAFAPDGQRLAAAGVIVTIWDLTARRMTHSFEGHSGAVRSLAFSPDAQLLASAGEDSLIGLWKLNAGGTP